MILALLGESTHTACIPRCRNNGVASSKMPPHVTLNISSFLQADLGGNARPIFTHSLSFNPHFPFLMSESFMNWDPAQVSHFLLGKINEDVTSSFIGNNIDGSLLPFITTAHLRELGITQLAVRLKIKQCINDLITSQYSREASNPIDESFLRLNSVNINTNYVSMEALKVCLVLMQDLSNTTRKVSDDTIDIDKLNENFTKLKTDLIPLIRLIHETKPLPTPTLDPGVSVSLPTHSTNSVFSASSLLNSDSEVVPASASHGGSAAATLVHPALSPKISGSITSPGILPGNYSPSVHGTFAQNSVTPVQKSSSNPSLQKYKPGSSPTHSKRFSSGSVLSMGVGKVADVKTTSTARFLSKPRLVDAKMSPSPIEEPSEYIGARATQQPIPQLGGLNLPLKNKFSTSLLVTSSGSSSVGSSASGQPLKQLKASSEDTCLKVLQHAMKRHHIPREKWSKYVLVVCYGDKERILKLTEKPVIIFKELQELGKNPAIMLRERAMVDSDAMENMRIGDDIPGGTL